MRTLSDTIRRLTALKALHATGAGSKGEASRRLSPLGGFGSNPGALNAQCYVPSDAPAGCPLVVVLHGCTQNAVGYDHASGWSDLADEAGFALLYPEQQRANNANLCFNWFLPGDTRRDAGEALSIRQMIEEVVATHGVDRDRIFVTGLSAGGAMAATMLATHPDLFAGGAIIAGLAHGIATTIPEAFDRMRGHGLPSERDLQARLAAASDHRGPWPTISVWHGSADQTVAPANAEAIAMQWLGVHRLDRAPTYASTTGRCARQVWCDPSGDPVLEVNIIAGMGHGTPLSADLGMPAPFMLDVGISSTREIAASWGIAGAEAGQGLARPRSADRASQPDREPSAASSPDELAAPDAKGIQKVLEDAFRAAGLMR